MEEPKIPEELQQQLIHAIQDLCMYIHAAAGMSNIMLSINHQSDALAKQGNTMITCAVGGKRIKVDGDLSELGKKTDMGDPSEMANEIIMKMTEEAKKKQG